LLTDDELTGSYPGQEVVVLEGKAAEHPTAPFRDYSAERWNRYLKLRRLDLASKFPQIPKKLVVAPIAPNTKESGFEEFALSIDGTLDCPVRP
jgi:hypothetical protein